LRIPVRFTALVCAVLCAASGARAESSGDYGRPRDSIFFDEFFPRLKGEVLDFTGLATPAAPYTDDELQLRDQAYAILLPPDIRHRSLLTVAGVDFVELWNLLAVERPFDVRSYSDSLIAKPYRSSTARYARLIDDIRADAGRAGPFFALAYRVLDTDRIRQQSFQYVRIAPDNYELARIRVGENRRLIAEVYRRFRERIASYRYALDTLIVLTPSPMAVEAERALRMLEALFAQLTAPEPIAPVLITK
jgi:hypothetical protein